MRFTEVWGETLKQNQFLKIISVVLTVTVASVGLATYKLSNRNPLVIERGCYSQAVMPKSIEITPKEMEAFLREALSYRFDSESNPIKEFFADDEFQNIKLEREDFARKGMTQMILIHPNSIKSAGDKVSLNTERIIMVGNVRSTIPFALEAILSVIPRTRANPYGIRIENLHDGLSGAAKKDVAN